MAENIGKIVVSIEAEVAELIKGLARAEQEFKKSAQRIEGQQKSLGNQFKKSWTELSNKINVAVVALGAAQKAVNVLGQSFTILGDDSQSAMQKTGSIIEALGNSGIPVVSQMVGIATELAMAFSGAASEMALVKQQLEDIERIQERLATVRAMLEMETSLKNQLVVQRYMTEATENRAKAESDVTAQFQIQRAALEQAFEKQKAQLKETMRNQGLSTKQQRDAMIEQMGLQWDILEELDRREALAHEEWQKRQDEKESREKERIRKIQEMEEAKAKTVADKTRDLETKLAIMKAKRFWDEEEAQRIAIEARYAKMIEGANEAQKKILEQMKTIELGNIGIGGDTDGGGTGGGGGTATISTAVGGFTVASGNMEIRKQTSLLKRIADATEKLGDKKSGEVIILPT